jgi:hypothetical protein
LLLDLCPKSLEIVSVVGPFVSREDIVITAPLTRLNAFKWGRM